MLLLYILFGFLYLNIGYAFGYWNWKVYKERLDKPRWLRFILWPLSTVSDDYTLTDLEEMFDSVKGYCLYMAFIWGLKLLWNSLWIILIILYLSFIYGSVGLIYILGKILVGLSKIVTYPTRKISKNHKG